MDWNWLYGIGLVVLNNIVLFVWKPWTQAYAGEKGKNLARQEDLDKILTEVRAVTATQKEIERRISDQQWHRQWLAIERRNGYVSLLTAFGSYLQTVEDHVYAGRIRSDDMDEARTKLNRSSDELMRGLAVGELFGSREFALQVRAALGFVAEVGAHGGVRERRGEIEALYTGLVEKARADLGVAVSGNP